MFQSFYEWLLTNNTYKLYCIDVFLNALQIMSYQVTISKFIICICMSNRQCSTFDMFLLISPFEEQTKMTTWFHSNDLKQVVSILLELM